MMHDIYRNLRFMALNIKYNWSSFMVYRTQAITWMVMRSGDAILTMVLITVIYTVSGGITGWTYFQMLALSGMAQMSFGALILLMRPGPIANSMREGGLDQMLLKPYNPILSLLSRYGNVSVSGGIISGSAILVYALLNTHISYWTLAAFIPMYLLGVVAVVMAALAITLASYVKFKGADWLHWTLEITSIASNYPATIYGGLGIALLSVVFPVTLASFFPATILFGKLYIGYAAAAAAAAIGLSVLFYKISVRLLKRYESGGG